MTEDPITSEALRETPARADDLSERAGALLERGPESLRELPPEQLHALLRELASRCDALDQARDAYRERFRKHFASSPVPAFIWEHREGGLWLVEYNSAADRITLGLAEKFVGRSVETIYPDRPDLVERFHACLRQERTLTYETPYHTRGTQSDRIIVFTFVYVAPNWVILHTEDVTERRADASRIEFQASLLDAVGQSVIVTDPEGTVTYMNQAASDLYGWSVEEAIGMNVLAVAVPRLSHAEGVALMVRLRAGEPWSGEFVARRKDGSTFPAEVHDTPVMDAEGNLTAIIGISTDITARKRAEERLRKSREAYRVLFESFPLGITVADRSGRVVEANAESERLLGISRDEHRRRHIDSEEWRIVRPDGSPMPAEEYASVRALREGRKVVNVEMGIVKPDGSTTWINVTAAPLEDDRVVVTYNDITARKRAEAALRESEARFRMTVQRSPIGVGMVDSKGRMVDCNVALLAMLGYTREELLRLCVDDFTHPDDREREWRLIDKLWAEEASEYRMEKRYIHKDGHIVWVDVAASLFRDATGAFEFGFAFVQDITERRRAETALRESERILNDTGTMARIGGWVHDLVAGEAIWTRALYDIIEIPYGQEPPGPDEHLSYYPPEDRAVLTQAYNQAVESGTPFDLELQVHTSTGRLMWCRAQGAPVYRDGRCVEMRGTFQDITERKLAEMALRQTSERLRLLHEIDAAILAAQSPEEIAGAALERLYSLIPYCHASVTEVDLARQRARDSVVIFAGEAPTTSQNWHPLSAVGDLLIAAVREGRSYGVADVTTLEAPSLLERTVASLGMRAYVCVPLRVHEAWVGTLNLSSDTPGFFRPEYVEVLEEVAASLAVALQQARLLEQTREAAEARALLLREVNHRVKNNLDAIIGLLYIERRHAPPEALPAYGPIMEDLGQRIAGLARVHQMLSETEWAPLNLGELAQAIIQSTVRGAAEDVRLALDVVPTPVCVSPDQAHHLALIFSELTINTLKHAVAGRESVQIVVRVAQEDGTVRLIFHNDGPGFPQDVLRLERYNAGLDIVHRSVRKNLQGELHLRNDAVGAVTEIRF